MNSNKDQANGKRTLSFTEARIAALKPESKDYCCYDTETSGFGVRVSTKGKKTFIWYRSFNGRPEREKLGRYPDLTVREAREKAEAFNADRASGISPQERRKLEKAQGTLDELFTEYIDQYAKGRCTTWKDIEVSFRQRFADWLSLRLTSITRIDVQTKINKLGKERGHHAANRALDDLRAVFNWGIKKNLFSGENPAVGVDKFSVDSRERFLQPDEIGKLFKSINQEPSAVMRNFILLSLYTGMRKSNILEMRWEYINFELGTWYVPRTKNGESQTVTLTAAAQQLLASAYTEVEKDDNDIPLCPWVFPGDGHTGHLVEPKGAWRRILERAGLKQKGEKGKSLKRLRIHDLRRTMGSYMAIVNVNSPLIQKALGHKSLQAASRYQRVNFDPVRQAMEDATAAIHKHAGRKDKLPDNVVSIKAS